MRNAGDNKSNKKTEEEIKNDKKEEENWRGEAGVRWKQKLKKGKGVEKEAEEYLSEAGDKKTKSLLFCFSSI